MASDPALPSASPTSRYCWLAWLLRIAEAAALTDEEVRDRRIAALEAELDGLRRYAAGRHG